MVVFGEFTLDTERFVLLKDGDPVKLEPRVFDVLQHLVAQRQRVVSKDELLETFWPDEHVIDSVITRCIYVLRKALAQDDVYGPPIATVRGRGYRFAAEVTDTRPAIPTANAATVVAVPPETEPFVGRTKIMAQLAAGVTQTLDSSGSIFLLVGEPGIGKTRTAEEVASRHRQDLDCFTGRCLEVEGAPMLWPWVQIVRSVLADVGVKSAANQLGASHAQLAALVPEMVDLEPPASVPDSAHYRLFDAVTRLMVFASSVRPRILILDDLHLADPPSLQLLAFMATEVGSARLLVIGTLRDFELRPGDPRRASLHQLQRVTATRTITLGPLSAQDVEAYVRSRLAQASPDVVAALHEKSEGNPFFMVEALRPLAGADAPHVADLALPDAILDLIRLRLERLPAACRQMLAAASVLGREFELGLVEELTGHSAATLLDMLDGARADRLVEVRAESSGRFCFAHGLIRETLYEDLPSAQRIRMHLAVAGLLEPRPSSQRERAYHLWKALPEAPTRELVDQAKLAAQQAAALLDHDAAAELYGYALDALDYRPSASTDELRLPLKTFGMFNFPALMGLVPVGLRALRRGKMPPIFHKAIPGAEKIRRIFEKVEGDK